jgi:hypothetical protein
MPNPWRNIKKLLPRILIRGIFVCIIFAGILGPVFSVHMTSDNFGYNIAEAVVSDTDPDSDQTPTPTGNVDDTASAYSQTRVANNKFENCGPSQFLSGNDCLGKFIIISIAWPIAEILRIVATFTDILLLFTISSATYADNGFIISGWEIVRDLTNILFIFMLLWIAIQTVLGLGSSTYKKTIPMLLVATLIVNFSLFGARVIVDIGNISSRVLFNSIEAKPIPNDPDPNGKSISAALVNQVKPQLLLSPVIAGSAFKAKDPGERGVMVMVGGLVAIFVNIVLIGVFLSVGMLFVGRVAGLWMAMILSPLAFAGIGIPWLNNTQFSPSTWFFKVFKLAILPTIFLFFVYLIIRFLDSGLVGKGATSDDFYILLIQILMPLAILVVLMKLSKKYSEEMADDITNSVSSGLKTAAGVVGGLALGGTAVLGRSLIGSQGAGWAAAGRARAGAATSRRGQMLGRIQERIGTGVSRSSFDGRQTQLINQISGDTGIDFMQSRSVVQNIPFVGRDINAINEAGRENGYTGVHAERQRQQEARIRQIRIQDGDPPQQAHMLAQRRLRQQFAGPNGQFNQGLYNDFNEAVSQQRTSKRTIENITETLAGPPPILTTTSQYTRLQTQKSRALASQITAQNTITNLAYQRHPTTNLPDPTLPRLLPGYTPATALTESGNVRDTQRNINVENETRMYNMHRTMGDENGYWDNAERYSAPPTGT